MKNLVAVCVQDTQGLAEANIEDRKKIVKLLAELNKKLILSLGHLSPVPAPLFLNKIHVDLIKTLIETGANIHAVDKFGKTFLNNVCLYLTPMEFMNLFDFLFAYNREKALALFENTNFDLHSTIKAMPTEVLDELFSMDFDASVFQGSLLLDRAVESGRGVPMVEYLISKGATMRWLRQQGNLLHTAASSGNFEVLKFLISEKGFNANEKDDLGNSPLQLALHGFRYDKVNTPLIVIKYLIYAGAKINNLNNLGAGVLNSAFTYYHHKDSKLKEYPKMVPSVKFLISHGVDVNVGRNTENNWLFSAARSMSSEEFYKVVDYLVKMGHEELLLQTVVENGRNILNHIVLEGKPLLFKTLEIFYCCGADFNARERDGKSFLINAVRFGAEKPVLEAIVKFGADLNLTDVLGKGPLHFAVSHANISAVQYFGSLEKVDINVKDDLGCTPLHHASLAGYEDQNFYYKMITELVNLGADGAIKNTRGFTPFHILKGHLPSLRVYRSHTSTMKRKITAFFHREMTDGESIFRAISEGNLNELILACESCNKKNIPITSFWKTYSNVNSSPLHLAVSKGQNSAVYYLLKKQGFDQCLNEDSRYSNLLHICAWYNLQSSAPDLIKHLVSLKPDLLNTRDPTDDYRTCLFKVALFHNFRLLVELGADPWIVDDLGVSPIHSFVNNEIFNKDTYHLMIEMMVGKNILQKFESHRYKYSPLHFAIRRYENLKEETLDLWWAHASSAFGVVKSYGNNILCSAIEFKKDINFLDMLVSKYGVDYCVKNKSFETVLHLAVQSRREITVEYFVEKGVDVNFKRRDGLSALQLAIKMDFPSIRICKILLKAGANVNQVDSQGRTLLHFAYTCEGKEKQDLVISYNKARIARLLIEYGADITKLDEMGQSVMHYATSFHPDVYHSECKKMMKDGHLVKLVIPDKNGKTPLHYAVQQGVRVLTGTVELFKDAELDFNAKENSNGNTALHIATRSKQIFKPLELYASLIVNGASCKIRNKAGQTCLHLVALDGNLERLEFFLKNGAGGLVNAKDLKGETPLHYATRHQSISEDVEVVKMLVEFGADVWAMNRRGQFPVEIVKGWNNGNEKLKHEEDDGDEDNQVEVFFIN